jgi:adenylate kinase
VADGGPPPAAEARAGRAGTARIVLLGRQGSGKGTQAERLSKIFGIPHVSTGEAFRAAAKAGTEVGIEAQGYMERGELVPDQVVLAVVREHLFGPGAPEGFVLDGFPRNLHQAEALEEMAAPRGIDAAVDLKVPTGEVLRRIAGRRVCASCGADYNVYYHPPAVPGRCERCGGELVQRQDDTEEAVRRRLEIYEKETAPVVDWYARRGLLVVVDATGDPDEVGDRLAEALKSRLGVLGESKA